jgi:hypothetical protein
MRIITFKLTGSPSIVVFFIAASFRLPLPSPALSALSGFTVFCWVALPLGPCFNDLLEEGTGRVEGGRCGDDGEVEGVGENDLELSPLVGVGAATVLEDTLSLLVEFVLL